MPVRKISQVRRSDGSLASFEEKRIAGDIYEAALTAGHDNPHLANDLSGAVTQYLERHYERDLPSTEEIGRMVEKVLRETGYPAIAREFVRRISGRVEPEEHADLFPESRLFVEGTTHDEVTVWGRERIIAALVKEADLEPAAAAEIAEGVERRVFGLARRRVSTALIRDVVNQELLARGFRTRLERQSVLGIPKYDLERMFDPERPDAESLVRTIGETTLKQYALQEIFSREVSEAHLEGRIHIHGLSQPLKLWRQPLRPEEIPSVPGLPAGAPRTRTASLARARTAAERRALTVEIGDLSRLYAPSSLPDSEEEAVHLLLALGDAAAGFDLRESEGFARSFLRAARESGHRGRRFAVPGEGEAWREFLRQAAEGAPTRVVLDPELFHSRPAVQAVTLNLPQTFFRSETDFYSELERSIEAAVRAHLDRRRLMERISEIPSGAVYAVSVAGLDDLIQFMGGRTLSEDDGALKLGLRIVSYLHFRLREESQRHGVNFQIEESPADDAAERFLRIDSQLYPRARSLPFDRYSESFHLRKGDLLARIPVEGRFHTLVPTGRIRIGRGEIDLLEKLLFDASARIPAGQVEIS